MNLVVLKGRLTANPELKQTQSGTAVTSFNIAVDRKTKDAPCDFITIVAWRSQAEFVCKYFKKGKPILVCGQLQTRSWTDKHGNKRISTEVVADEVSFVAPSGNGSAPAGNGPQGDVYAPAAYGAPAFNTAGSANFEEIPSDESLPF